MTLMLDRVLDSVLSQPLHAAAQLELVSAADGRSEIRYQVNDMTSNVMGMLHGGVVCLMQDVGMSLAVSSLLPTEKHAVTAEAHSSLLRPANRGETIIVRSQVDRLGRAMAFMRSETFARGADGTERLIATGSVTKAVTSI